ncbi:MAG TPA: CHASE domain-containing protein [Planctomycetota bacterium]|jgi:PAS domain S-box-containing protein|nr:CHASE domain-containing protein [Planctomycetota bacterium]
MSPTLARLRSRFPDRSALSQLLATALACCAFAMVSQPLAMAPGSASPVQPEAGIALAAVLLAGPRVWPAIVLGIFAADIRVACDASSLPALLGSIALSLAVGLGAAAQALVARTLVRRFAGYPSALTEASDVLRFLMLGGPVSGVIAASVGTFALFAAHRIGRADLFFTWSMWWVGASIGTALFAPVTLLWCPGRTQAGVRRRISLSVPLGMMLGLSIVLFLQVDAREKERVATDFERRTDDLANGIERSFDGSLEVLDSLGSFYDASHRIDRREFSTFARYALSRSPSVRVLAWCPRVKDAERLGCVRAARLEVDPAFAILEADAQGALVPAKVRDEYVPEFYVETREKSDAALGLDATSDHDRKAALERARDEGVVAATPPMHIGARPAGDDSAARLGLIVYRPVYGHGERHETLAERRTTLAGYATAEFSIDGIMREGLRGGDAEGIRVQLFDVTDERAGRALFDGPLPAADGARTGAAEPKTTRYALGGRVWELRFRPDFQRVPAHHPWQSWYVLAAGLLFTGLLEAFLLVVTGRTDAIEELVARRTAELQQVNSDLRHEVAERARAEAQHESSELRLAAAQQIAHLGSWELDLASRNFLCSDELCRIQGLAPDAAPVDYEAFLSRIHPEDREIFTTAIDYAVRNHRPFSHHHRIVRPDDEVRTLQARGDVILDADGKPIRIQGTGQDVTDLKRAERELARRTLDLERSNAELERFAYVASHDLQEPLRAVASHVQILEQDYRGRLDDEADESIRCAVEGAQRMHDLINDYLAYSRVRTGSNPLQPTSSERALEAAQRNLEQAIRDGTAEVTHDELPDVLADPTQLVQLFQNLVGNAVKFRGDEPPRVHVSAQRADGWWLFSVSDNGIGIDPEHTGGIFSLFKRLHTHDRYPGTGIGLAICRKIIDRHGGKIWVESMPGMGATFRFTLPSCGEEQDRTVEVAAVEPGGSEVS